MNPTDRNILIGGITFLTMLFLLYLGIHGHLGEDIKRRLSKDASFRYIVSSGQKNPIVTTRFGVNKLAKLTALKCEDGRYYVPKEDFTVSKVEDEYNSRPIKCE